MLGRGALLRAQVNEKRARGSYTRSEASCASIGTSEILAEDSSRRPQGHVRRLPRQLSFFGFQGDDNQDSINRVRSNRCRVPAGLRSDSSHHGVCGRPKRRSQRVAQDFAANTVGRIKKEYQERDWVVLGTSPVGCSCVISWRKRNCSSCAIRVVLRSEFIGMEPGIYRGVSNLKQTSLDAETAPSSPEAVLPD
ncbi:hypothetical protein ACVIQY_000786 [Bradyrhizobium sp. USDA 3051]